MCCRHGYFLLALIMGTWTPAGCMRWQCFSPQMLSVGTPAPSAPPTGQLTPAQAAQLCVTAGEALEKKGFTAEAIHQFENARAHYPSARGVSRHLAVLYDLQGEAVHAETEYRRAMQEQSRDAELLNDFGYFNYRHNQLQAAENWLGIATTVDPNCQRAWVNLGQVLACQGREEESYRAFAHVLRPAEAYSNLGVLLAKHGRTAQARRALEQALALEPGLQQPRAFLNALTGTPRPLPPGLTSNPPSVPTPNAKPLAAIAPFAPRLVEAPKPALPMIPQTQGIQAPPRSVSAPCIPAARPCYSPTEWMQSPAKSIPAPAAPIASAPPTRPSRTLAGPAVVSDLPSIVNGPIRPVPIAPDRLAMIPTTQQSPITPPTTSIVHKTPPAPPPPPPPLPPFAPPASKNDAGPALIRTTVLEVQSAVSHSSSSPPKLLPSNPVSTPLIPKPAPPQGSPSAPPQVVITDCQSEPEPHGTQEP